MLLIKLLNGFNRIDFPHRFVSPYTDDSGKAKGIAARVPVAFLNAVKSDFQDDCRLDQAKASVIANSMLFEELSHVSDFLIRQSRVSFSYIQELPTPLYSKGVVGKNVMAPAVTEFDASHDDVKRG